MVLRYPQLWRHYNIHTYAHALCTRNTLIKELPLQAAHVHNCQCSGSRGGSGGEMASMCVCGRKLPGHTYLSIHKQPYNGDKQPLMSKTNIPRSQKTPTELVKTWRHYMFFFLFLNKSLYLFLFWAAGRLTKLWGWNFTHHASHLYQVQDERVRLPRCSLTLPHTAWIFPPDSRLGSTLNYTDLMDMVWCPPWLTHMTIVHSLLTVF